MVSKHSTGSKQEALLAAPEIIALAHDWVGKKELEDAEIISSDLIGSQHKKDRARQRLAEYVGSRPKRPLYYFSSHHVWSLPRFTRDGLRDLGDYLDRLCKVVLKEATETADLSQQSFGRVIGRLRSLQAPLTVETLDALDKFNTFIYRGAKHEFDLPRGRSQHRFTSREVVLAAYIAKALGAEICRRSPLAEADRTDSAGIYENSSAFGDSEERNQIIYRDFQDDVFHT